MRDGARWRTAWGRSSAGGGDQRVPDDHRTAAGRASSPALGAGVRLRTHRVRCVGRDVPHRGLPAGHRESRPGHPHLRHLRDQGPALAGRSGRPVSRRAAWTHKVERRTASGQRRLGSIVTSGPPRELRHSFVLPLWALTLIRRSRPGRRSADCCPRGSGVFRVRAGHVPARGLPRPGR